MGDKNNYLMGENKKSPLGSQRHESSLPDHLLSENSIVKRERYNQQIFAILMEKMLRHLEIIMQMERWKTQNKYDEKMMKEHMRMDEVTNFFKMLGEINRENHDKIIKLSIEQLIELQQRLEKIAMIKSILSEKILQLSAQISKTKNEITSLHTDLDTKFTNYKKFFSSSFDENADYQHFKPIDIPSELTQRGNIYIDHDKFRVMGKAISDAIEKHGYTGDREKITMNVIELHIKDQILVKNAHEEYKIEAAIKEISKVFNQHLQQQPGYDAMQNNKVHCNLLLTEISQKYVELASLKDDLALSLKQENALDEMSSNMQKMVQDRECNKDIFKVLSASCDSTIDEILHKIDREPVAKVVAEEATVTMRMR